jgi:hypothetical protein
MVHFVGLLFHIVMTVSALRMLVCQDVLLVSVLKASNCEPVEKQCCENLKFSIATFLI